MAIDTAVKRRSALGVSALGVIPLPDSEIVAGDRAMLLRRYIPFAINSIITPLNRVFAIMQERRILTIQRQIRTWAIGVQ